MEQPLSRTVSAESTQSWQQLTTASGASAAGRKARSSEPETGAANVERASVSLPPLASKAIRQMPSRRPSKASDNSLFEHFGSARNGSAIEEEDTTPTLEATRGGLGQVNPLLLPEAFRLPRSDVDGAESHRLSFSSLYSIGSAIFANNRGHSWSGRNSIAGLEPEGAFGGGPNFTCLGNRIQTDLRWSSGQDGRNPSDNHRDDLSVRHHVEPEWQSGNQSVAHAIALSPRPGGTQSKCQS